MKAAVWWQRLRQPSLVRRLLGAQFVVLAAVWIAFLAMVAHDISSGAPEVEAKVARQRAELVLALVERVGNTPEELREVLSRVDVVFRGDSGVEDSLIARDAMVVRSPRGDLLFQSPVAPAGLAVQREGELEPVVADGRRWSTFSMRSPSGVTVTLVRVADHGSIALWTVSSGLLALPLLMGLPFILLAAWVSVRLALRPWRRLTGELAGRGADDVQPLRFEGRHRELVPLTQAIDGLLRRVREGQEREKNFVADAAHELRTPLAAMRVHVEALQETATDARQRELLEGVVRSNERATRLVAQLLSLMRSEPMRPAGREIIALAALVQERLSLLAPLADEAEVELEFQGEVEGHVLGEAESLAALVDNLVQNAIKHSPPGATVQVRLSAGPEGLQLEVTDNGPGIPEALRERVFDRFYRIPDQRKPGSGLGLSIVLAVARRHGARVTLSDTDTDAGRGLRARVIFAPAAVIPPVEGAA